MKNVNSSRVVLSKIISKTVKLRWLATLWQELIRKRKSGDLIFSREKWPRFFLSFFLFLVEGQRSLVTRFYFPSRLLISLSGFVVSGKTVVPLRGGGRKKKKRKKGREGRKGSRFSHISPSSSHSPSTPCPFLVIRLTTAVRSVYFEACTRECLIFASFEIQYDSKRKKFFINFYEHVSNIETWIWNF